MKKTLEKDFRMWYITITRQRETVKGDKMKLRMPKSCEAGIKDLALKAKSEELVKKMNACGSIAELDIIQPEIDKFNHQMTESGEPLGLRLSTQRDRDNFAIVEKAKKDLEDFMARRS